MTSFKASSRQPEPPFGGTHKGNAWWGGMAGAKPREVMILPPCLNVSTTPSSTWTECLPNLSCPCARPLLVLCLHFALRPPGLREDDFSESWQGSWVQIRMPGLVEGSQRIVTTTPYACEVLLQSAFLVIGSRKSHTGQGDAWSKLGSWEERKGLASSE